MLSVVMPGFGGAKAGHNAMNISMLLCGCWVAILSSLGYAMTWQSLHGDDEEFALPSLRSVLFAGGAGMIAAMLFVKFV